MLTQLPSLSDLPPAVAEAIDQRCQYFEKEWTAGRRPRLEDVLDGVTGPERRALLVCTLRLELELLRMRKEQAELAEYARRFPEDAAAVAAVFAETPTIPLAIGAALPQLPRVADYRLERRLGGGGMGDVYLAEDPQMRRQVALKLIRCGWGGFEAADLARHEAAALARLQDPHVVTIYQVDEHEGRPYLCLEYVAGGSLADRLKGIPQPPREAAVLVEALALTLHRIHGRGLVHRDLKPGNILLVGEAGLPLGQLTPKVTDFGLVKYLDAGGGRSSAGMVLGTPEYMAPEQARGDNDGVDCRADVYALGAILYKCLTGRPPFRGITMLDTLQQVVSHEPVSPRELNPALDAGLAYICLKCLAKDPKDRYHSAAELAADLRRWQDGETVAPTSWWDWLLHRLNRPFREEEYFQRHVWRLRTEAATALAGHVGFFLLLTAGMPGQVLWAWLLLLEVSGGWVNWLWGRSRRVATAMERDILQLWTGAGIANLIIFYLHCPLWGPVQALEVVRFYPVWAAVFGLLFYAEGRFCGGRLYLVSALFFAAAVGLPLAGLWSPVIYGLLYSAAFVWFSLRKQT